ncbi:MAG: hypothetical protein ACLSVG_07505 [Clostridia bacterium]
MIRKNVFLIFKFFKDIEVSAFLLLIVLCMAQFSMLCLFGEYQSGMYYKRCFDAIPGIERSIYFGYGMTDLESDTADLTEYQELLDKTVQTDCVERVITTVHLGAVNNRGRTIPVIAFDSDTLLNSAGLHADQSDISKTGIDKDGNLQIFLPPDVFSEYKTRNRFCLKIELNESVLDLTAVVSGRYKTAPSLPRFDTYSNATDFYKIISEYQNAIFIMKTPETEKLLLKNNIYESRIGFFVFSENSSEKERNKLLEELKTHHFSCHTYDEIVANSKTVTDQMLENALPLPILTFTLSLLFSLTMIVLILDKKMQMYSVCYLYGLNKRKSYFLILGSIGFLEFLSMLANAAVSVFYIYNPQRKPELIHDVFFSWESLYLILAQAIFLLGTVLLEIYILYRKKSFIEIKHMETK